jgi:RHS repeat-associated protein
VVAWVNRHDLPGGGVRFDIVAKARNDGGTGLDTFTYGYDALGRLTSASGPDGDHSFAYDPVGNRTGVTVNGVGMTATFDRADRITASGATSITVNAAGNLTARGADSFAYDAANRLTSATVGGSGETYSYNGDGVRASRTVGANPVIGYVSDVNRDLPVTLDDGTRKYVWGLGLAYAVSGSSVEVVHADRLGSVRAITDGSGSVVASYRTDAWGNATTQTGSSTQPYGFTGEPVDASGLVYLRARYYDPGLGRFMTRDAWAGAPCHPQSLNRYAYASSDPTNLGDPSGRKSVIVGPAAAPPPMSPECSSLYTKIQDHIRGIVQKFIELKADIHNLQSGHWTAPDPNYGSVVGHQDRYRGLLKGYDRMHRDWDDQGCPGDPPSLAPEYREVPNPDPKNPGPSFNPLPFMSAPAAAYLIYRIVRLLPSLAPPAWPTLVPNLATP